MAGTYRTFMVDPLGALPATLGYQIQSQLAVLFSPISGNDFENNWVFYDPSNPSAASPTGYELLVYFMPAGMSIVKHAAPRSAPPVDPTRDGFTWSTLGASEVYVKTNSALLLAKLAFHELMHNRLRMDDGHLHPMGGLAAASITDATQITTANIQAMRRVLRVPITQWTAGIRILTDGIRDPLSEYYRP